MALQRKRKGLSKTSRTKSAEKTTKKSNLEKTIANKLVAGGYPPFKTEYRFHVKRLWRFDFAFPEYKVAVEVEGGLYANYVHCRACGALVTYATAGGRVIPLKVGGRHNSGAGFEKDMEKYNEAAIGDWLLVRLSAKLVRSKKGLDYIARALMARGWEGV